MRRVIQDERGFTLIEMLVVCGLMTIVLSAVLGAFDTFGKTSSTNQKINDTQDTLRVAVDGITRELRNLASPTNELPDSVVRANPDGSDLIFLSVAGNKPAGSLNARNTRQVRYCLASGTLYREEQTWTTATAPAVPATTACSSTDGWPSHRVVVSNITNGTRPVFSYNSTTPSAITDVAVSLWVDPDPGHTPTEVQLQSAVFLRNQNRAPTADFTIQVSGGSFVLNASDSNDPEGRSLSFYWYDEARSDSPCTSGGTTLPAGVPTTGCIGTGLVFNYRPPVAGNRTIHVIARDPAGLQTTSSSKACNSTGTGC